MCDCHDPEGKRCLCPICVLFNLCSLSSFENLALGDCPPGWSLNGENCYYVETRKVKYAEAKAGCEAFGATLTSIHSPEEQSYHSSKCSDTLNMYDLDNEYPSTFV